MELLTATEVRHLLDRHGLAPRKRAGQNFVVDPNTVRKIVRDAALDPELPVLEIGPGLGSLTRGLLDAAARVVAVEVDAGLVRVLEETLGGDPRLQVVHGDAMRSDLGAMVGGGPAALVANLPYHLATPLLLHALTTPEVWTHLYVMVQKEVAQRWAARPGHPLHAAVSVKLSLLADATLAAEVPRTVFLPVPNVDSAMVRIVPRPDAPAGPERAAVVTVIEAAFAQRRKTLRNNLARVFPRDGVESALAAAELDGDRRAEELDAAAFVRLTAALAPAITPDRDGPERPGDPEAAS